MTESNTTTETGHEAWADILTRFRAREIAYVLMGAGILFIEFATGPLVVVSILFVIPVALAGWFCGPRFAYALSVLFPLGQFALSVAANTGIPLHYAFINNVIRIFALTMTVFFAIRARETVALRERVRTLEGLLPICSFCKSIRDEKGDWTRMETYISERSQAEFTHGYCPGCMEKHYGDFLKPNHKA